MLRRRWVIISLAAIVAVVSGPWLWTTIAAMGHLHDESDAPSAEVVIVLGGEVAPDRATPAERLAGRLQTAAELVHTGRAETILVSGDGGGESGDEIAVMTAYLADELGVDRSRVRADPYGLDTYDTCIRARDVFGITRALIVTQSYHLSRAVTVCRSLGIDTEGVRARCDGCSATLLAGKAIRDYFASIKAAWDVASERPPAVTSLTAVEVHSARLGDQGVALRG